MLFQAEGGTISLNCLPWVPYTQAALGSCSQGTAGNPKTQAQRRNNLPKATQTGNTGTGIQTQPQADCTLSLGGWSGTSCGWGAGWQGTRWGSRETTDTSGGKESELGN